MPANSIDDRRTCEEPSAAAVQALPTGVAAGASILLRGHRCRLDETVTHRDCRELHVTRLAGGSQSVLLWPFDRPAAIEVRPRLRPVPLRHWRRRLLRDAAFTIDPLTPRTASASLDVVPFQLAPAVAMAAGACRILLADEVGLGKTIQAGWIVADVTTRDPGARVLLAVPAGLRHQWADELSTRFGIARSCRRRALAARRGRRPAGGRLALVTARGLYRLARLPQAPGRRGVDRPAGVGPARHRRSAHRNRADGPACRSRARRCRRAAGDRDHRYTVLRQPRQLHLAHGDRHDRHDGDRRR